MDSKIDVRQALRVYQKIVETGEKQGYEYALGGLLACSDFDGYTVTLRNDYVRLDIQFHSKYSFNFANKKEKIGFLEKMAKLDRR